MGISSPRASNSGLYADPREDWLAQHTEDVIDPSRPIVDPHHHLWEHYGLRYMIEELAADLASGHNVIATVYVDAGSGYRADGPEAFRPIGEVEFATGVAAISASGSYGKSSICAGIVGHVNLLLGDGAKPVLEAAISAGSGRFRGIRHSSAWDPEPIVAGMYATRPKELLLHPTFRKGFACLAPLGLSFDAWLFHPQIGELTDLARTFPDTRIVLDHCGGPVGLGRFAGKRDETMARWKASIQEIAKCPNVVVKLGGLAMWVLGYDFHMRPRPPSSEQVAAAWRPYIEICIEAFGPSRAMFESNFPPDKGQCSYQVIFNAFKRLAAQYTEAEKTALFSKTAIDFYKLNLD
ncbi:amidohydrolase family protein [Bradyrhizobium glycinis]|uniref:amidohydrolase family protein n=1 Tax=Bradyrhizobium glycinis TaxID=2751812 RepID=UPI0018D784CE|nr:amidohydrolase family protein [Bradyrhizobium glycinis]MBH5371584.1 amidohydrolase [Bradyrhizobium glycinis]